MSYSFNPLSDEELDAIDIIKDGVYNFQVVKSTQKTSKAGNSMAELQLVVWDQENKQRTVFDYLVFSSVPLNIRKVKHFCESVGLIEEYKKGNIRETLEGLSGKVMIGTQNEQPSPHGGFYPKKNCVLDYVLTDKGANMANTMANSAENDLNDGLPF